MIAQNRPVVVFGVCILAIMSLAAYLQSKQDEGDGHPSSYSNLRRGAKAAYLLLQQDGYPVERWDRAPKDLPADGHGVLLVVAEPVTYPNQQESSAFSRFLFRGGSILAAGMPPDAFVSKASAMNGDFRIGSVECQAMAPTHLTRGGPISQDGFYKWDPADSAPVVHFADPKGGAVVVSYPVSNGSVIWWASAWPLENAGIREKNNLELLLNSTSGFKRVLWDEYYQHVHARETSSKPIRAYSWAMAQLVLIALAIVLTYSRRSGPLVPVTPPSRRAPLEFVETLAGVFHRAGSTQVAVEIAFQRFRQVAARRLGIRGTSGASEIVDALTLRGVRISGSNAKLVRESELAIDDETLTERAAMAFVRALNEATSAMEPAHKTSDHHPKDSPERN